MPNQCSDDQHHPYSQGYHAVAVYLNSRTTETATGVDAAELRIRDTCDG